MRIHKQFVGGNIRVVSEEGDTVFLENELRDTVGDWFYWAFCVEEAAGRTVTFRFGPTRLGPFGPAVSRDLVHWQWLDPLDGDSFTYTFSDDAPVYFAHNMVYPVSRFDTLCEKHGWKKETFCLSARGREIPCITVGAGEKKILLTARHHACESTGSYVLEGVLDALASYLPEDFSIFCVPYMDYDGVLDGDQGKNRAPYDHNRDYAFDADAVHPACAALRRFIDTENIVLAFDFHSPYHCGGANDHCFIVQKDFGRLARINRFGEILAESMTEEAFLYEKAWDHAPGLTWNKDNTPTVIYRVLHRDTADLAFSLETAYFGTENNRFTAERGVETGRCFADAMRTYIRERGL